MDKVDIVKAVEALKNGELVIYPTDTLYALGADIFNDVAVRNIYRFKKRPFNNPLPVAVSCFEEIEKIAYINNNVDHLVDVFLPGGLTLILKKKDIVSDIVTGGLKKIGIRIPNNEIALDLLSKYGPLTVTSANIHGGKTPSNIAEIKNQFNINEISCFLDYGVLEGLPSTIVDLTDEKPLIIREGIISKKNILDEIKNG